VETNLDEALREERHNTEGAQRTDAAVLLFVPEAVRVTGNWVEREDDLRFHRLVISKMLI
jgi:hypothetical protein